MNPISILMVDDDSVFVDFMSRFLQKYCQGEVALLGTAEGGKEGLVEAERLRPQVVLLDLRMPGLSGIDVLPDLRKLLPEAGIIAMSLIEANPYRRAALAAGADEFVCKDNIDTDLMPAIRRVAYARQAQREAVEDKSES